MHDESRVGRGVSRMHFAEPGRHVGVEASNEGNAGRTGEPGGTDSSNRNAEQERERSNNPACVNPAGHVTYGLHDALQDADVLLTDCDQQGKGGADIEKTGKNAAPGDCAGKNFSRIFDFIAHYGGQLETYKTEADHTKGVQHEAWIGRNLKIGRSDGGSEAKPHNGPAADEHGGGDKRSNRADIIAPFSYT